MTTLKLYLAGALILLFAVTGFYWHHRVYQQGYDARAAQDAKSVTEAISANAATEARWRATNAAAQQSYSAALEALRNDAAAQPVPAVFLCKRTAAKGAVSGAGGTAGRPDGAAPAAGVVPQDAGRDRGPELFALADRADRLSEQLRALEAVCH